MRYSGSTTQRRTATIFVVMHMPLSPQLHKGDVFRGRVEIFTNTDNSNCLPTYGLNGLCQGDEAYTPSMGGAIGTDQ